MDRSTIREMQAIREAEAEVAPFVGPVLGMDSAAAIYKEALKRQGHDVVGIAPASMKATWQAIKGAKARGASRSAASIAQDEKSAESFAERFPDAARIKTAF